MRIVVGGLSVVPGEEPEPVPVDESTLVPLEDPAEVPAPVPDDDPAADPVEDPTGGEVGVGDGSDLFNGELNGWENCVQPLKAKRTTAKKRPTNFEETWGILEELSEGEAQPKELQSEGLIFARAWLRNRG